MVLVVNGRDSTSHQFLNAPFFGGPGTLGKDVSTESSRAPGILNELQSILLVSPTDMDRRKGFTITELRYDGFGNGMLKSFCQGECPKSARSGT